MSIAELRKLPRTEKLNIIEALWSDLAGDQDSFASPVWHEDALRKTEGEFAAGRIEILDWEVAKKELRKRLEWRSGNFAPPLMIWRLGDAFTIARKRVLVITFSTAHSPRSIRRCCMRLLTRFDSDFIDCSQAVFLMRPSIESLQVRPWCFAFLIAAATHGGFGQHSRQRANQIEYRLGVHDLCGLSLLP